MITTKSDKYKNYALIILVFTLLFSYCFDSKIDGNGDNAEYYQYAQSLVQGHGYSALYGLEPTPTNNFPPGYSVLLAPVMFFTDSFVVLKIYNGLLLLLASLLFYKVARNLIHQPQVALLATILPFFQGFFMSFATMLMAEMAYYLFIAVTMYALLRIRKSEKPVFKNPYFYLLSLATAYAYHTRTAAVAMVLAVLFYFLMGKKWKTAAAYLGSFLLLCLPWWLRNKMLGLGSSRYFVQMMQVNPWRPDNGELDLAGLISRLWENWSTIFIKTIPDTMLSNLRVDYGTPASWTLGVIAVMLLIIMSIGWYRLPKLRWFVFGFIGATIAMLGPWNGGGGSRYLCSLIPLLFFLLTYGMFSLLQKTSNQYVLRVAPFTALLLVFFNLVPLMEQHQVSNQPYPPAYSHYYKIADEIKKKIPQDVLVVCRKPALFSVKSGKRAIRYAYTKDAKAFLSHLLSAKADFIVAAPLGYSSDVLYLIPHLNAFRKIFPVVRLLQNPNVYLMSFNKKLAAEKLVELELQDTSK